VSPHPYRISFPRYTSIGRGWCEECPCTGKTWQPGDFTKLLDDVTTRVFDVYPDSTVIYPGHGDDTVLGAERPSLDEWRQRGW
jgi:glyoxylase-like metal-dependent hydrolase (beta-lactamase superfamily II)